MTISYLFFKLLLKFLSYLVIPEWENDMSCLKDGDKGCPLLLVITASAKRSVDLLR